MGGLSLLSLIGVRGDFNSSRFVFCNNNFSSFFFRLLLNFINSFRSNFNEGEGEVEEPPGKGSEGHEACEIDVMLSNSFDRRFD